MSPTPFQDRLDPGRQFSWAERFDDVVVGSDLEPDDPIDLVVPRGQEDDGNFGETADRLAEFEAIPVGQSDVEDDQLDRFVAEYLETLAAQPYPTGLEAVGFKGVDDVVGDRRLVFDDQDGLYGRLS